MSLILLSPLLFTVLALVNTLSSESTGSCQITTLINLIGGCSRFWAAMIYNDEFDRISNAPVSGLRWLLLLVGSGYSAVKTAPELSTL